MSCFCLISLRLGLQTNDMKGLPKILWKYRVWGNNLDKRVLTDKEIFFASPSLFNDPFDCSIPFRYDKLSKRQLMEMMEGRLKELEPNLTSRERWKLVEKRFSDPRFMNTEYLNWHEGWGKEYIAKYFGIFSLTRFPKQIVMWSHYADAHKGFCVGFDVDKLKQYFEQKFKETGTVISLDKVEYSKDYPLMIPGGDYSKVMLQALTTKSAYWKYEQEYRLTMYDYTSWKIIIPDELITKVILGVEMCDRFKDEIKRVLLRTNSRIALYQAKMKRHSFELIFDKFHYY